jgi:exosortase/archaeosortase family protein
MSMISLPEVTYSVLAHLRSSLRSFHSSLILLGLLIGLCYLPSWLTGLLNRGPQSADGLTLATCFVGLSFYLLWKQQPQFATLAASEEDRLLGYILIICGIILFPVCRFALWPQALLWALILVGITCCIWGLSFFRRHSLLVISTLITVYPRPTETARLLWQAVTPYEYLERGMAQAGAGALKLFGWQASAVESLVMFPEGAVDVDWGCNGFDMALTMMVAGLMMGLFLKQGWWQILGVMGIGVVAALLFNVPRVMLLAVASVYWGEVWFEFWHGPWGGQVFSAVLFTVYYYTIMAVTNPRTCQITNR